MMKNLLFMLVAGTAFLLPAYEMRLNPALPMTVGVDCRNENRFVGTIADLQLSFDGVNTHHVTAKGETLIEVLPALPSRWQNGSVKGFRARGGHTVDFTWRNGKVVDVSVHGGSTPYKVQYAK